MEKTKLNEEEKKNLMEFIIFAVVFCLYMYVIITVKRYFIGT